MIEINNLSKSYSDQVILDEVDLEVPDSCLVGLIGPNGVGKTTLLRTILGLEDFQGKIWVDGEEVKNLSRKVLAKKLAHVPQESEVNFEFTVKEVVSMARITYNGLFDNLGSSEEVEWALEKTSMFDNRDRYINTLSGGELQRTMIARALAQETQNILFDEPTQHLDIGNKMEIMDLITHLSEDKSVLCVFHDLNLASMYCDKLALLSNKKILARGNPENVLVSDNIKEAYGRDVLVTDNPVNDSVHVFPKRKV